MVAMTQIEKKVLKKEVNRICAGITIYILITFAVGILDIVIRGIDILVKYGTEENNYAEKQFEAFVNEFINHGEIYICGVLAGIIFLFFYFRKSHNITNLFHHKNKMTPLLFIEFLCVFMGTQLIFSYVGIGLENLLNRIGYTNETDLASASATSVTVTMFIYASLLGPVIEEIIFRGFVMKGLERYGKEFAILFSALLFGLMHGNLCQNLFAFLTGIILGYVAMEYSLKWSVFLHILNNCLFGDLLGYLLSPFSEHIQNIVITTIEILFFIAGCVILYKKKNKLSHFHKRNKAAGKTYRYAFSCLCFILFAVMQLIITLGGIEKISDI